MMWCEICEEGCECRFDCEDCGAVMHGEATTYDDGDVPVCEACLALRYPPVDPDEWSDGDWAVEQAYRSYTGPKTGVRETL